MEYSPRQVGGQNGLSIKGRSKEKGKMENVALICSGLE